MKCMWPIVKKMNWVFVHFQTPQKNGWKNEQAQLLQMDQKNNLYLLARYWKLHQEQNLL